MKRLLTAVLVTSALTAGCSGASGESQKDESRHSPSATPTQAASPTATTQQYASIVARNSAARKSLREMSDCDWLGSGRLDYSPDYFVCNIGLLTMSYTSKTLALSLSHAQQDIGSPPSELDSLVSETVDSARTLSKAAAKANAKKCAESGRGTCSGLRADVWLAMGDLQNALQAWGPYL